MTAERRCPRCGTLLSPADPGAEPCRRCLLALGLSAGLARGPGDPGAGQDPAAPEDVGPYRVLDVLGAGAEGVVYLAEPREASGGRVALKVTHGGVDPRAALARLRELKGALAGPSAGLAGILEAGRTGDGRVWLATEWVRGVPITEHCDRGRLAAPRRLELFVEACECIQHAHDRGVLHGSIKPSNVLVGGDDVRPTVRVTDLGVARALDHGLTEEALGTAQGHLTATPAYFSPEQLDSRSSVDERSDVYSLGVLLYELLAGTPPFDPRMLRHARWADVVRTVREEPPRAPSRRVRAMDETQAGEVAAGRGVETRELIDQLRGDLDAICLKALEKQPARRYSSVGDLARDARRHLSHEPVVARPPGPWRRLGRVFGRP